MRQFYCLLQYLHVIDYFVWLESTTCSYNDFWLTICDSAWQFFSRKASKNYRVNGPNSSTGPSSKQGLRDHGIIDDDSVSFGNTLFFEDATHFADIFINLSKSPLFLFIYHIGDPDETSSIGLSWQISIDHIVGDVDFSVSIPTIEWWIWWVENSLGEFKPTNPWCLFFPELFAGLILTCSIVSYIVQICLSFRLHL